jgi:hypothetical protein
VRLCNNYEALFPIIIWLNWCVRRVFDGKLDAILYTERRIINFGNIFIATLVYMCVYTVQQIYIFKYIIIDKCVSERNPRRQRLINTARYTLRSLRVVLRALTRLHQFQRATDSFNKIDALTRNVRYKFQMPVYFYFCFLVRYKIAVSRR